MAELTVTVRWDWALPPSNSRGAKSPSQSLLGDEAPYDLDPAHRQEWHRRFVARYSSGMVVVKLVMTASSAQSHHQRECLPTPPCTSNSLLIVESHRRHVRKKHGLKTSDIDADLHCCRNAQDVNVVNSADVRPLEIAVDVYNDVSEVPLAERLIVSLCGQFLRVQSQWRPSGHCFRRIIVAGMQLASSAVGRGSKLCQTAGTYTPCVVQVLSRAEFAHPRQRFGGRHSNK